MAEATYIHQHDTLSRALAVIAIVLSLAALVWSYQSSKRSREALDKVHQTQTTTNSDGSKSEGLMKGTDQPPAEPPTQVGQ